MQFKEKFMSLSVGKGARVMDIVRQVQLSLGDMSLVLPDADKVGRWMLELW